MRELPSSQVVTQARVVAFELLQEIVDGVDLWDRRDARRASTVSRGATLGAHTADMDTRAHAAHDSAHVVNPLP